MAAGPMEAAFAGAEQRVAMRALLYSRVDPADEGGVQSVFKRLGARLRGGGHAVVLAWRSASPPAGHVSFPLPRLYRLWGVPTPRSLLRAGRALLRLGAGLRRHRPEVVNVHYVTSEAVYFQLLRPLFRYRLVLSVHGSDVLRPKACDGPLLRHILSRADAITTVSQLTARTVQEAYGADPRRVTIIPNGVDFDFWSWKPAGDATGRSRTVLSVGRLHPVKGHDVLLRAFAIVLARVPDARLAIFGDGNFRKALEDLAVELQIAHAVSFAGQAGAEDVRAAMRQASCFVLPSRSEGLPLALLEAMAAGLPVVATRVGGVPEVIDGNMAALVPPEDPAALADATCAILLDPLSRCGSVGLAKERARQYSAAGSEAAYERLLTGLAATARTRGPRALPHITPRHGGC